MNTNEVVQTVITETLFFALIDSLIFSFLFLAKFVSLDISILILSIVELTMISRMKVEERKTSSNIVDCLQQEKMKS